VFPLCFFCGRSTGGLLCCRCVSSVAGLPSWPRAGQFDEAVKRLHAAASKIASYAGSDAELQGVLEELQQRNILYSGAMPRASMKKEYSASLSSSRMRDESGKARRRPTS